MLAIWEKLKGYKTYLGLLITLLAFLVEWVPEVATAAQLNPDLAAKVVGSLLAVLGLLHKIYRVADEK